ncbi:MAG TPA: divergent PAP2 family protein [Desulfosporosinus sp.]
MFFALAPFIGWLVSGCLKFAINYVRFGKEAKDRIGNGGFPSTHTTIITTTTVLIGWHEGFSSPIFGLGVAVILIIVIDAAGLRRAVGHHAVSLNQLKSELQHRESIGHTKLEILGGLVLGVILGTILYWLMY